jgi:hypothetical protein
MRENEIGSTETGFIFRFRSAETGKTGHFDPPGIISTPKIANTKVQTRKKVFKNEQKKLPPD